MKLFQSRKALNVSSWSSSLNLNQDHNSLQHFLKHFNFIREHCIWRNHSVNIACKLGLLIDHMDSLLIIQWILCHFNSLGLFWMCFWNIFFSVIKNYGFGAGMIRWHHRIWVIQKVRLDNHNCSLWPHRLFILCIGLLHLILNMLGTVRQQWRLLNMWLKFKILFFMLLLLLIISSSVTSSEISPEMPAWK